MEKEKGQYSVIHESAQCSITKWKWRKEKDSGDGVSSQWVGFPLYIRYRWPVVKVNINS